MVLVTVQVGAFEVHVEVQMRDRFSLFKRLRVLSVVGFVILINHSGWSLPDGNEPVPAVQQALQEIPTISEIEIPANVAASDADWQKFFNVPENAPGDQQMWEDVREINEKLRLETLRVLAKEKVTMDSAEFTNLILGEKIKTRTNSSAANLTLVDGALVVKITHLPTEDAILIGPKEVLNPLAPRTSHIQKFISRIFAFAGANNGGVVRSRNIHLVRIASAAQASVVEYLAKPKAWLSYAWYHHYINGAFTKPSQKHVNSALISTFMELGMMYGIQTIHQFYDPAYHLSPATVAYAAGFSLVFGMFANGIRQISQFGNNKGWRFLKISGITLAYSVPITIFTGKGSLRTIVGWSLAANKSADVTWQQIIKFDDSLRTMPGDVTVTKLPFRIKIRDVVLENFGQPFEMGSRVTLKSIMLRMPRFVLKFSSIIDPTAGVAALFASIPIMAVVARDYALRKIESADINRTDGLRFVAEEMEGFWTRAYDTFKVAMGMNQAGLLEPWSLLKGFVGNEFDILKQRFITKRDEWAKNIDAFETSINKLHARGMEIALRAADYTNEQIEAMTLGAQRITTRTAGVLAFTALASAGDLLDTSIDDSRPTHAYVRTSSTCRSLLLNY